MSTVQPLPSSQCPVLSSSQCPVLSSSQCPALASSQCPAPPGPVQLTVSTSVQLTVSSPTRPCPAPSHIGVAAVSPGSRHRVSPEMRDHLLVIFPSRLSSTGHVLSCLVVTVVLRHICRSSQLLVYLDVVSAHLCRPAAARCLNRCSGSRSSSSSTGARSPSRAAPATPATTAISRCGRRVARGRRPRWRSSCGSSVIGAVTNRCASY